MDESEQEQLGIANFEERRGAAGIWRFVAVTTGVAGERVVKALSEWGQTYEFKPANWLALPRV